MALTDTFPKVGGALFTPTSATLFLPWFPVLFPKKLLPALFAGLLFAGRLFAGRLLAGLLFAGLGLFPSGIKLSNVKPPSLLFFLLFAGGATLENMLVAAFTAPVTAVAAPEAALVTTLTAPVATLATAFTAAATGLASVGGCGDAADAFISNINCQS
jgi:hypothetical protein